MLDKLFRKPVTENIVLGGGAVEIVVIEKLKAAFLYVRGATDEAEFEPLKMHLKSKGYFLQFFQVTETPVK